jgi:hypothetical protein
MPWENRVTDMSGEIRKDPIVPPLVIGERWDLAWFPSVRAAEGYFEPWYAHEDYVAFDSSGQRLILDSGGYRERRIWRSIHVGGGGKLTIHPTGQHDPEAMRSLLLEWFRRSRTDNHALANGPLAALIERAVAVSGWTYDPR